MLGVKTLRTVLLAVVVMFAQVIGGVLLASPLPAGMVRELAGPLGITLTGLLLVYLIRRFLDRRPWSALGWHRPSLLFAGVLAGALPILAAQGVSLAVGAVTWVRADPSLYAWMPLTAVVLLLNQAFPEELLWRGHVVDSLSARLSPRAVVIVSSVAFGALHIISNSPADGVVERLLYVVMATALGFACTAARLRSGGLWMAVGVHLGFHLALRVLPLEPVHYGVALVLQAVLLALAGLILLRPAQERSVRQST